MRYKRNASVAFSVNLRSQEFSHGLVIGLGNVIKINQCEQQKKPVMVHRLVEERFVQNAERAVPPA